MKSRRAFLGIAPFCAAAALAACSSAPTFYYRLAAVPGAIRSSSALSVSVRGVSIPDYLDQSNIVKPSGAYSFASYNNDLWAGSLAGMLQSTMVQDLGQRLPAATVIGSGSAIGAPSVVIVELNILRFDADADGAMVLDAQLALRSGQDNSLWLTRHFQARGDAGAATGQDAAGIAAAMSALWGQAADEVAGMILQGWAAHS